MVRPELRERKRAIIEQLLPNNRPAPNTSLDKLEEMLQKQMSEMETRTKSENVYQDAATQCGSSSPMCDRKDKAGVEGGQFFLEITETCTKKTYYAGT